MLSRKSFCPTATRGDRCVRWLSMIQALPSGTPGTWTLVPHRVKYHVSSRKTSGRLSAFICKGLYIYVSVYIARRSTAGRNKDIRPNMRIGDMQMEPKRKWKEEKNSRGNVDEEEYASNKKVH